MRYGVEPNAFFEKLWQDYTQLTPQAGTIYRAFCERNGAVRNDHVAFRTFNHAPISLEALEPHLWSLGYRRHRHYEFEQKKLSAWGYQASNAKVPLIFFSELLVERLSLPCQDIIRRLVDQVDKDAVRDSSVFWSGRLWSPISWQDYQALSCESEYAAWLAALGFHANHFTIAVHHLAVDDTIEKAVEVVKSCEFPLNQAGGVIKGSPEDLLVQASTMADRVLMSFSGGDSHEVSSCYYEFAQRFRQDNGQYYPGFVAANADKIFDSTSRQG